MLPFYFVQCYVNVNGVFINRPFNRIVCDSIPLRIEKLDMPFISVCSFQVTDIWCSFHHAYKCKSCSYELHSEFCVRAKHVLRGTVDTVCAPEALSFGRAKAPMRMQAVRI